MQSISFGGLASGLDTNAIIDALVAASREPIRIAEQKQSDFRSKLSALGQLRSHLSTLQTATRAIDGTGEFKAFSASSSNDGAITAVASSGASRGSYVLNVTSLAQAERTYSATVSDQSATNLVGTGTLTIQVGTATAVNVSIDETTDTLETVAQKINSTAAEVTANVVYDGSSYRLLVTGNDTGAANAIAFAETGTLATKLGLTAVGAEAQAATDASMTMDSITFTSATNQISTAVPGVVLDLKSTTASGVTVQVDLDTSAVEKNVQDFVDAYNNVAGFLKSQFEFTGEARTNTLSGDVVARSVQSRLQSILGSSVAGVSGTYSALSRIGVSTERDGTLKLDGTALKDALAKDLSSVNDLFTLTDGDANTANDGIAVLLEREIASLLQSPDGSIAAREDGLNRSIRTSDDRIARLESNLERYEEGLRRQFAALEQVMSGLQSQSNFLASSL